jgi:hypothetical protein
MDSSLNFQQHLLKQDYLNSLSKSLASQSPTLVPTPSVPPTLPSTVPSVVPTPTMPAPPATVTSTPSVVPSLTPSITAPSAVPSAAPSAPKSILKSFLGIKQTPLAPPSVAPDVLPTNASPPVPTPTISPAAASLVPTVLKSTPAVVAAPAVPATAAVSTTAVAAAAVATQPFYTTYGFMAGVTLFLLATGIGVTVLVLFLIKKKKQKKLQMMDLRRAVMVQNEPTQETIISNVIPRQAHVEENVETFTKGPEKKDEYDDPQSRRELEINSIFPSTQDIVENSEEATFAKQYTYENLHDSMFARPKTKPSHKSHSAAWESNVQDIKEEMEKSGQTLDDYLKSSNAPVSDEFVDAWKSTSVKVKPRDAFNLPVPKYAQKEMPALVSDSTQVIPLDGKTVAHTAMEEILNARKRAKVLGVSLPSSTQAQKDAVEKWSKNEEKSISSLANSLKTMM